MGGGGSVAGGLAKTNIEATSTLAENPYLEENMLDESGIPEITNEMIEKVTEFAKKYNLSVELLENYFYSLPGGLQDRLIRTFSPRDRSLTSTGCDKLFLSFCRNHLKSAHPNLAELVPSDEEAA